MHLATWNVNSLSVRLPHLLDWLADHPVDVLALQELKLTDDKFPAQALEQAGYAAAWLGQKTYNGVALLVRSPGSLGEVQRNIPGFEDEQARVIAATVQPASGMPPLRVIGAYFPNGQAPGSDKFAYKMRWLDALRAWVAQELARHPRLVLMGDFNITVDDDDVWDPDGLRDTIHCTREERAQLQALKDLGLHDAFRLFPQPPKSYSWWDYRQLAFPKNRGLRIDHILISDALKPHAVACTIDRAPRKRPQPSDHAPVVLTLAVTPTPAPESCG
ncbi:Exodeoxyribonuclease III [Tepidimonas fonticaldi]|uniref:Exodeoxyribonuclease III n=1 Tax=Tepidimonas fonticaldi TaxID=1101373 RepID=A0A554XLI9_9BURK|nr:exodeoxyribonuclease III [Tepidimonas fonticaldi]TSE36693.1 Exodeoxyribonuclease III [Tepidimonas fonticaldi]